MKLLGIIGGVGPESTIEYYKKIIADYQQRLPDGSYPKVIINSINLKNAIDLVTANRLVELAKFFGDEVGTLVRAGAEIGLIAANTPHIVFEEIQRQSAIPLISIVEAASRAVVSAGLNKICLFGTRFTMEAEFYPRVFSREGIKLAIPNQSERDFIHDKYMNELLHGIFLPETHDQMLGIVDRLKREEGIQAVILGGTELPLILTEKSHRGVLFLDTTEVHAKAAVDEMLS
jgi:aspartate racemase